MKLRLRPSTTLRGRILAAQGIDGALELQPADARVRIVQVVNEEQGEHPKAMEAECDEQGRFLFSDVPTGQWELGATDIDWACGTKFSVHPGPNDLGDLVLEPRGPECTLRGTILFDPGALDLAFCVVSAPLATS
ncbi:MAG: hypothetical protein R3E96_06975 [Planctomycetota bacterium]